uniref:Integrase catalytic domain-containing protein n=1 Tax=Cacopsylla melanoneura TaxID=428564 RepID=A0A8D8QZ38_9HEMI
MAPTAIQQMETAVSNRERHFTQAQQCFDLIKVPQQENNFLIRCQHMAKCYQNFESTLELINTINPLLDTKEKIATDQTAKAFDDLFFAIRAHEAAITERKKTEQAAAALPAPAPAHHEAPPATPKVRLPVIVVPQFEGDISKFPSWLSLYNELVHEVGHLTPIQKFSYLRSYLTGSALKCIDTIAFTAANYPLAYRALSQRFYKKRTLASSLMNKLLEFKPLQTDNLTGLRSFLDHFYVVVESIRSLTINDLDEFILVHLGLKVLDHTSSMEFEKEMANKEFPTFTDLTNFIRQKADVLEQAAESESLSSKYKPRSETKRSVFMGTVGHSQVSQRETSKIKCYVCSHGPHKIVKCPKFTKLDVHKRFNIVKELKLCFACLSATHFTTECESVYRCRTCQSSTHHSLLHFPSQSSHKTSPPACPADTSTKQTTPYSGSSSSRESGSNAHCGVAQCGVVSTILLGTAVIKLQTQSGHWMTTRCVIDPGSQVSIITERLVQHLHLPRKPCSLTISGIGSMGKTKTTGQVACTIRPVELTGMNSSHNALCVDAVIMPKITSTLPNQLSASVLKQFRHIQLADTTYYRHDPELTSIDVLLGAEHYGDIILHTLPIIKGMPNAVPSIFGYLLFGKAEVMNEDQNNHERSTFFVSAREEDISCQLQKFWALEEVGPAPITVDKDDQLCEDHFIATHTRDNNGRYVVKLPVKDTLTGSNRAKALRMFYQLEKRLDKNPTMKQMYSENLQTYLDSDHMEEAKKPSDWFLSHHGVHRETSSTTKLRVVFNPNLVTTSGQTLSQVLHVGPKLQLDIQNLLVIFRLNNVALLCDVQAMYRCIMLAPEDRAYQHIFWRNNTQENVKEYELKTVTFGLGPSPFLAQRVIKQLAVDEKEKFPSASSVIQESIYVDDIVTGSDSVQAARELRNELIHLMKAGGFHLRKWASSHPEVLDDLASDLCETPKQLAHTDAIKVLGIQWCPKKDAFCYAVTVNQPPVVNKRSVLSVLSSIYDVNGMLSPVIINLKIFMQKLWLNKVESWDTPLSAELTRQWSNLLSEMHLLCQVSFPRYILGAPESPVCLIGFADASHSAYAGVVYLRVGLSTPQIHLLRAKTKVAPLKVQTINRLELCAALLLAKIVDSLSFLINKLKITNIYLFSDSTTVLSWLRTQPHLLKTFVANRVVQILEWTEPSHWHHVSSGDNSADPASRGLTPSQFLDNDLWFNGPSFLQLHPHEWNLSTSLEQPDSLPELKSSDTTSLLVNTSVLKSDLIENLVKKYSSLSKLQKVMGFVLRFVHNTRNPHNKFQGTNLSIKEMDDSLIMCVKLSQAFYFSDEIRSVSKGNLCLPPLRSLSPLINSGGLLVVGGRLANASIPEEAKHPILLSKDCHLTYLIILTHHIMTLHGGPKLVQSLIQRKFWIVNARSVIRSVLSKCVFCTKLKAQTIQPIMADLPTARVTQGRPFQNVGVDFGGPFSYKTGPRRNSPVGKCYLALFVCMATKSIHLELVSSLSTAAFIATLDRFIGRRGLPQRMFSDNGTNFRGTASYLQEVQQFLQDSCPDIIKHLLTQKISWSFSPANAPNFGGIYESGIKSAKHHLKQVLHEQVLNFEEFATLLVRVEAILNSRPLCSLSSNPNDGVDYLSPGHFLTGAPLLARPDLEDVDLHHNISHYQRWKLISQATSCFWKKWSHDYINTLMQRSKWTKPSSHQLQVGDVVLIQSQATPPQAWPLGRVTSLHPGQDSVTRAVTVKTQHGELSRPVSKLVPLPVSC